MKKTSVLFHVAVGVTFLVCGCTGPKQFADKDKFLAYSRDVGNRRIEWRQVLDLDFASIASLNDFRLVRGKWRIDAKCLWAYGDEPDKNTFKGELNRAILLARDEEGPLRIEMEVTNYAGTDGSIGDITLLINTDDSNSFFENGYALTTASYYNTCSTFYRLGNPIAKTEYSPVVSGTKYRVVLEMDNGHIRYWLNDTIILEAWDPEPLKVGPNRWLGVRTWNTLMAIRRFTVFRYAAPPQN